MTVKHPEVEKAKEDLLQHIEEEMKRSFLYGLLWGFLLGSLTAFLSMYLTR